MFDGTVSKCPEHRRDARRARVDNSVYGTPGHLRFREAVLTRDYICTIEGCVQFATVADHFHAHGASWSSRAEIPTIRNMGAVYARLTTTSTQRLRPQEDGPPSYDIGEFEMNEHEEVTAVADRLIDAFATRAGSEDATKILGAYADQAADGDGQVIALARLAMKLAERAADATTVYDIWAPERPIVPAKIDRLTALVVDAGARWARELKKQGEHHG